MEYVCECGISRGNEWWREEAEEELYLTVLHMVAQSSLPPNVHNMTAQYPPFHVLYSHDGIEEDQSEEIDEECYFESSSRGG